MSKEPNSIPAQIGPYKILRELGAGGMGTVYRAVHAELRRDVALKVLTPNSARNEVLLKRFQLEARAAAMPYHENIVLFYEHGSADGYHYMALEYVRGRDLGRIIREHKRLPVSFSLHIVKQVARALEHAHKHGFVHRDIKPSNLLITKDKHVKLTDMGLARQLEELEENHVTRDGTTVGTVDYMAPEQAHDSRSVDIRGDIYSLGCTWFQMLAGTVPYRGGTALERLYKHSSDPIPDVRDHNPKVPDSVAYTIERMMAKSPKDRFQTPTQLLEELESLDLSLHPSSASLADLVAEEEAVIVPGRISSSVRLPTVAAPPVEKALVPKTRKGLNPVWFLSGLGIAFVLGAIAIMVISSSSSQPPGTSVANATEEEAETTVAASSTAAIPSIELGRGTKATPKSLRVQAIDQPAAADAPVSIPLTEAEKTQVYGPWTTPDRLEPVTSFAVRRTTGADDATFSSIRQAWTQASKALAGGRETAGIVLNSDGPLFLDSMRFSDRPLVIRAAKDFTPLAVFEDLKASSSNDLESSWFRFDGNGRVEIEGVHFTIFADDIRLQNLRFSLFSLHNTDLSLRRCTFTVLGTHRRGIDLIALTGDRPAKILIEDCVLRGESVTAVRAECPADTLVENSCLMTSADALFVLKGSNDPQTNLRLANSTLVAGHEVIRLELTSAAKTHVVTAGSVFVSPASNELHPMLQIHAESVDVPLKDRCQWTSIRSAYVAWPALAVATSSGKTRSLAADLTAWRSLWQTPTNRELTGDAQLTLEPDFVQLPYPELELGDWRFPDHPSTLALIGYDATRCLKLSEHWFENAYGRFVVESATPTPPEAPVKRMTVTLDTPDALATAVAAENAEHLEVQLQGDGMQLMAPVRLNDKHLRIVFAKDSNLVVVPTGSSKAVFEVTSGSLQIEDGRFEWAGDPGEPERLALLNRAPLTMTRCWIKVPLTKAPAEIRPLVEMHSEGDEVPCLLRLKDTLLMSPATVLDLHSRRYDVMAENCVLIAGQDAFSVQADRQGPQWSGCIRLDHCSISVAGVVARLNASTRPSIAQQTPLLFDVTNCLLTDLVDAKNRRFPRARSGAVLAADGDVLDRQAVTWQGSHNGFDQKLASFIASEAPVDSRQTFARASLDWFRLWGIRHEAFPVLTNFFFDGDLDSRDTRLEGLALRPDDPATVADEQGNRIGADLRVFGVKVRESTRQTPAEFAYKTAPLSKTFALGVENLPVHTTPSTAPASNRATPPAVAKEQPASRRSRSERKTPVRVND